MPNGRLCSYSDGFCFMYTVFFLQLLELLMIVKLLELLMVDRLRIVIITKSRVRGGVK